MLESNESIQQDNLPIQNETDPVNTTETFPIIENVENFIGSISGDDKENFKKVFDHTNPPTMPKVLNYLYNKGLHDSEVAAFLGDLNMGNRITYTSADGRLCGYDPGNTGRKWADSDTTGRSYERSERLHIEAPPTPQPK
jgi:hypothetical protein